MAQSKWKQVEGIRSDAGREGFEKLARVLGYGSDVDYMLQDNPYMLEAVLEAVMGHGRTRDGVLLSEHEDGPKEAEDGPSDDEIASDERLVDAAVSRMASDRSRS